jgi:hypothetical protein
MGKKPMRQLIEVLKRADKDRVNDGYTAGGAQSILQVKFETMSD